MLLRISSFACAKATQGNITKSQQIFFTPSYNKSLVQLSAYFVRDSATLHLPGVGKIENPPLPIFSFKQMKGVDAAMTEFFTQVKSILRIDLRKISVNPDLCIPDKLI